MQYKIDLLKIESYSSALAEKLCNDFYQESTVVISGNQILNFSSVEQLNIFVLKNLFDKWKEESAKLRSPYFDYEQEEVKEALTAFLNKLSRYISIRKEFFKPLLKKSISDTIAFILSPGDFLKAEYMSKPIISIAELIEREKYIRINKFLLQSLIKKLQLQNKSGFSDQETLQYFNEIYKNYESSLENPTKYIDAFSSILRISLEDLIVNNTEQASVSSSENVQPKETKANTFKEKTTEEPSVEFKKINEPADQDANTLNEFFSRNKQLSLNDALMKESNDTLISNHKKSKIHDLKTAVPLNMKYIFINELFKGGADDYNLALTQVERCDSFEAAKNILDQLYAKKYEWNAEKNEVKEFYELIERRFF